jgi:hypothetical protein
MPSSMLLFDQSAEKKAMEHKHDMEKSEMVNNHKIAKSDMEHKHEMDKLATEKNHQLDISVMEHEKELLEDELTAIDDLYEKCMEDEEDAAIDVVRSFKKSRMEKKLNVFKKYGASSSECRKRKAGDSEDDC